MALYPDQAHPTRDTGRLAAALAERYRVERELGVGGMATVYLADDVRHGRKVAIKVLHPELSAVLGPERFLTEIRTTANLQHPHILPLFDSGAADGLLYYVMPFIDGETLRARLDRERQLPVPDAVRIATEVADALEYAHRQGVIHRDIKPENILLQNGHALVADFGIALAVEQAGGQRMTQTGLSLGTPQYMAPEQAMGERSVDARADIYALGAVTYEMLAGEPPFTGPTAQAIVAKVMTEEPRRLIAQRRSVPADVEAAVATALEKLPADRFASAKEFADALSGHAREGTRAMARTTRGAATTAFGARTALLFALFVLAVLAAAGGWTAWYRASRSNAAALPPSRLALLVPRLGGSGTGGLHRQLTLTADGSAVLFVGGATSSGGGGLRRQSLDGDDATLIPGTQLVGYAPSISPDGRWIASRDAAGNVMRIPSTGTSQSVRPLAAGFAFYAWHPDGSLWITRPPYRRLERILPASDSLQVMLGPLDHSVWLQQILDDGRTVIAVEQGAGTNSGPCTLLDLESGTETQLIGTQVVAARYTAGYLVWSTPDGSLFAQPFDPGAKRVDGVAVTIATGVSTTGAGDAQFDVARNGMVAYAPGEPRSLVLVDRNGTVRPATEERHDFHMPRFSPDGRRLSVDFVSPDGRDVWMLDRDQQVLTRLTVDHDGHDATWMPDGHAITYSSDRSGVLGIYRVRPGTMAPPESLMASPSLNFTGEWLPDASGLLTVALDLRSGTSQDLAIVRNGGRGPLEPLLATRFREMYPALSRDGRWVAFVSDQSGRDEVYARPLAGSGDVVQVSQGGGTEPLWARSGRELFYRGVADGIPQLMDASVEATPSFRVTGRKALFPISDYMPTTPHANYDISPDGNSFVMVRANPASRIVILQNLPALVARLAGRGARGAR